MTASPLPIISALKYLRLEAYRIGLSFVAWLLDLAIVSIMERKLGVRSMP